MIDGTTIKVKQGADHVLVFRRRVKGTNGAQLPYPIPDGTTFKLQVKAGDWADAVVAAEYTPVVLDADQGDVQFSLDHDETEALDVGAYVYNMAWTTAEGFVTIVRSGPWRLVYGLADD